MITEWLARAAGWFWTFLCGLFPKVDVPSWFGTVQSATSTVNGHMNGLGAWFPFQLLGSILVVMFAIAVASLATKVVRIVASFFTLGGGSAA